MPPEVRVLASDLWQSLGKPSTALSHSGSITGVSGLSKQPNLAEGSSEMRGGGTLTSPEMGSQQTTPGHRASMQAAKAAFLPPEAMMG